MGALPGLTHVHEDRSLEHLGYLEAILGISIDHAVPAELTVSVAPQCVGAAYAELLLLGKITVANPPYQAKRQGLIRTTDFEVTAGLTYVLGELSIAAEEVARCFNTEMARIPDNG